MGNQFVISSFWTPHLPLVLVRRVPLPVRARVPVQLPGLVPARVLVLVYAPVPVLVQERVLVRALGLSGVRGEASVSRPPG